MNLQATRPGAKGSAVAALLAVLMAGAASEAAAQRPYICRAKQHTVVVDRTNTTTPRYRGWKRPKPITAPPDLVLTRGEHLQGGTGPCATRLYGFTSGDYTYQVSDGLGCGSDETFAEALMPDNKVEATGHLYVSRNGEPVLQSLCFTPKGLVMSDARRAATPGASAAPARR